MPSLCLTCPSPPLCVGHTSAPRFTAVGLLTAPGTGISPSPSQHRPRGEPRATALGVRESWGCCLSSILVTDWTLCASDAASGTDWCPWEVGDVPGQGWLLLL